MKDHPIPAPEDTGSEPLTRAEAERQLSALVQKLTDQIEAASRQETVRREALDARETQLCQRELAARARELLADSGLPVQLAEGLAFTGEEALKEGVALLEDAFRAAVQKGVEERLLASAPKTAALKPLSELSDEDYYTAVCRRD